MGAILSAVAEFFKPAVVFFISIGSIVSFLLGALANPQGWMNSVICTAIDYVSALFPSTPANLKVSALLTAAGSSMPAVGSGVIREILSTLAAIFALTLVIKIYKLLPFKAT